MKSETRKSNYLKLSRISFVLSLIISAFWIMGQFVDYYAIDFIGAIFEILWLPMIALLFFIPVISVVFWAKVKFQFQSLFLYTALIGLATIVYLFVNG